MGSEKMLQSFKVRLEPNNKQITKLFQYSRTARFIYNWTLAKEQENYKTGGKFIKNGELRKELTRLKKTSEYSWLNAVSNNVAKQAVKDACDAYIKFFKGLSKIPKFKSRKKSKPSFYVDSLKIQCTSDHIKLEAFANSKRKSKQKLNWIKLSEKYRIPFGESIKYYNPRVTFDGSQWYISVGVEVENIKPKLSDESIGIDLGLKNLAIVSNIDKPFKNINKTLRVKKLEKRLKRFQRQVSRKYEMNKQGNKYIKTNNTIKLETKINTLHKRLNNIHLDYRHKVTTEIVKTKPFRVVMEKLNVTQMLKNKHLSQSVSKQGFYEFKALMKYKCEKNGIEFIEADKWYPSSKTCSKCGYVKSKLSLSERTFICECCGAVIDRDKNASINLSRYEVS